MQPVRDPPASERAPPSARRDARLARALSAPPSPWKAAASAAVFVVIAILAALDAIRDLSAGVAVWNVSLALALTAGALATGSFFLWRLVRIRRHTSEILRQLGAARADAERWRQECAQFLPALGEAILRQFDRWSLTPDEQEIALLVLNGLLPEQIAERRQAPLPAIHEAVAEIYRKAGVSSASALSAFFLRDLLFLAGDGLQRRSRPPRP